MAGACKYYEPTDVTGEWQPDCWVLSLGEPNTGFKCGFVRFYTGYEVYTGLYTGYPESAIPLN